MERRNFLKTAAAAVGVVLIPKVSFASSEELNENWIKVRLPRFRNGNSKIWYKDKDGLYHDIKLKLFKLSNLTYLKQKTDESMVTNKFRPRFKYEIWSGIEQVSLRISNVELMRGKLSLKHFSHCPSFGFNTGEETNYEFVNAYSFFPSRLKLRPLDFSTLNDNLFDKLSRGYLNVYGYRCYFSEEEAMRDLILAKLK